MNIKAGLVGLPNVGKSTLFNALTNAGIPAENYPFCTIDPHVAITEVPDTRMDILKNIYNSQKKIPTIMEFVDIAGLVKGAASGEGLGNQFLSNIKEVALIIHVVRCFEDSSVLNTQNEINPIKDFETIIIELALKDLESSKARLQKLPLLIKKANDSEKINLNNEAPILEELIKNIEDLNIEKAFEISKNESIKSLNLLLSKPFLIVANISENEISNPNENKFFNELVKKFSEEKIVPVSVKMEAELSTLDDETKNEFLKDFGLKERGIKKLIQKSYYQLSLITYFTCGPKEIHAWTIKNGTNIKSASGEIHSDLEKGFISANVISYSDIESLGSELSVKNAGKLKTVGATYIVNDGDILNINFNV